jgi:hypothetical protein
MDDATFKNYWDILEALDPYYGRSMFEKVVEAQQKLQDSSPKQKPGKDFAAWRGPFMSVARLLKMDDATIIGFARQLLKPHIADRASIKFDDQQL